jgi:hypothetical protein
MTYPRTHRAFLLCFAATLVSASGTARAAASVNDEIAERGSMFTYLLDTGLRG